MDVNRLFLLLQQSTRRYCVGAVFFCVVVAAGFFAAVAVVAGFLAAAAASAMAFVFAAAFAAFFLSISADLARSSVVHHCGSIAFAVPRVIVCRSDSQPMVG